MYRVLFVAAILMISVACGDRHAHANVAYSARTSDGHVSFEVPQQMVRSAFDDFCNSSEAQHRCAAFEDYKVEVGIGERGAAISFLLLHADVAPASQLRSFGCLYLDGARRCVSGDHQG